MISVVPLPVAVTLPSWSTAATKLFNECHDTVWLVALLGATVALNFIVSPFDIDNVDLSRETPETGTVAGMSSPLSLLHDVKPIKTMKIDRNVQMIFFICFL